MKISDFYPAKAQFSKNEGIQLIVELDTTQPAKYPALQYEVRHLHETVFQSSLQLEQSAHQIPIAFSLERFDGEMRGYTVNVHLLDGESILDEAVTAFDRAESWKGAPRYGFLSDFGKQDGADESDIARMNKYHINLVQFYDWMYRHYRFFPPEAEFSDPFDRQLSMETVHRKIEMAHRYGMKAFAYGAVYGAQKEYFEQNKELALYQNDGTAANLGDFLINMDISRESRWHDHIIGEFSKAIFFGFDGIHMDQYGQPKEAVSMAGGEKKCRQLKQDFYHLINDTKKSIRNQGREPGLIFNAVNNWPIESVAGSAEDTMYIEVWPPNDTYNDLYRLVSDAKKYCKDKQVILAAYIAPFLEDKHTRIDYAQNAALMATAAIYASGGFHLVLGETDGLLQEAYYVHYAHLTDAAFCARLRDYADFMTANEELLFDYALCDDTMTYTGGINNEYTFQSGKSSGGEKAVVFSPKAAPGTVWTMVKEKPEYKIIHLLNYIGIKSINWNEEKESLPQTVTDIEVTALILGSVRAVRLLSPDEKNFDGVDLPFTYVKHPSGKAVRFTIPSLSVWDMVYIAIDE